MRRLLGAGKLKQLAADLIKAGKPISEMMVIRCLHQDESKRIGTIEAIEAISDWFHVPRCVVIAENMAEALAIQGAVAIVGARADADRLKIPPDVRPRRK